MRVDGEPVDFHSPTAARDAGIAVIYQEPTLFPDLSIAENVVMGRHPLKAARRIDRARDARAGAGAARAPRGRARRRAPGARPLDRRPADRGDRQGAVLRRPRADHGRADRRAVGQRGRAPLQRGPQAARGGRRGAVHLAPPRGGLRDLRQRHGDARRRRRARRADRRDDARRHGAADGRPRPRRAVPQGGRRDRRAGAPGAPPHARGRVLRRQLRGQARGRSSRSRAWSARAAARWRRAIFGIDKPDAGHVEVAGRRLAAGPAAGRHARRDRLRARGPPPAGPRDGPLDRPQRVDDPDQRARPRRPHHAARSENRLAREWAARLQLKFHRLEDPVGFLSGGNQQKVVLVEVARDRAEAADPRRADARHRRRHQGRGPPADERARRPGPRGADDLQRAARGARHGRPRAGHARGPARRRAEPRRGRRGARDPRRHRPAGGRRHERRDRRPRRGRPRAAADRVDLPGPRAGHHRRVRAARRRHGRSSSRASSRPPRCATSRSTPRSSPSSPSVRRWC